MKVYGYEVPKEVEEAAIKAMTGAFVARDVERAVIAAGAPEFINMDISWRGCHLASMVVNRLLQRERKKGRISFISGKWFYNEWSAHDESLNNERQI